MTALRDKTGLEFWPFADAASFRARSTEFVASQRKLQNQPFKNLGQDQS